MRKAGEFQPPILRQARELATIWRNRNMYEQVDAHLQSMGYESDDIDFALETVADEMTRLYGFDW